LRLEWSRLAVIDRDGIFDYIETENPLAAIAVDDRIRAQVQILKQFPLSGRLGRIDGTRELVVVGTPYVAGYIVSDASVRILRSCTVRGFGPMTCPASESCCPHRQVKILVTE
jgi:toxin ParE1/3/4